MIHVKFNGQRYELIDNDTKEKVINKLFLFGEEAYHYARKYFGGHQTVMYNRDGTVKFYCDAVKNEYIGVVSGERDDYIGVVKQIKEE